MTRVNIDRSIPRDSNMELLRIVAMIFILIGHANYVAFDRVIITDGVSGSIIAFARMWIQAITVSGVNIFVLISGWFGISFKWKKLASLLFEVLFFNVLIVAILLAAGLISISDAKSLSTILMLNGSDLWFVKAYIGLLILAPALNLFVEKSTEKQLRITLILFYSFQSIYGWLALDGAEWIEGGFSAWSFIGLYLLARYLRIHMPCIFNKTLKFDMMVWFTIVSLLAVLAFILLYMGYDVQGRIICSYTNPICLASAVFLLVAFSKLHFSSRMINWIAASCFAVYLFHANELVLRTYYGPFFKSLYDTNSLVLFVIYSILTISVVFITAILVDKVRNYLWKKSLGYFEK